MLIFKPQPKWAKRRRPPEPKVTRVVQTRLKRAILVWGQVGSPRPLGEYAVNKFATAALAAVIATGSIGIASAADAQSRHDRNDRQEQRQDRRDDRRDDRQEWRQDNRDDRREYRQDVRAYDRYQRSERRYNAGRYAPPRGYQTRQWAYGQRIPSYYSQGYVVNNYSAYGLRAPPRGYQYVRSGNDVVLAAVAGGLITAVIAGLFN